MPSLTPRPILSVLLGAIALFSLPLAHQTHAEEASSCPANFEGIKLRDEQQIQLATLEKQYDSKIEFIIPASPDAEARVEQLEQPFEQQISALLSPEQEQQISQLDAWAQDSVTSVAPELEIEEDPELGSPF